MNVFSYVIGAVLALAFWLRVVLYLLVGAIAVAIAGYFGVRAAILTAAVVLLLGLALLLYTALAMWVRRRKAAELRGEVEASGIKRRAVDPNVTARIAALRDDFELGLAKIRTQGKDLYEVPWFLVIGETGIGKTEAVRRSGLEFAPNLQDRNQGLGGTAHLDWWFTNFAVLLDTAGEVVFGFSDASTTPDWEELTRLLKRNRRVCPLNGVVLAISAESLLNDSPIEAERKAGVIARHLDTLREQVGARFPVFIVITKCDVLPGFLPFFQGITDPKTRQQMLGWSNPAALEAPLRPELLEEHFQTVAQRLRRRRLSTLLDPLPRHAARRIDEVDSLFDLPQHLTNLLPGLRVYLNNVFVAGEWSAQPLFLRGVYLTSAVPGTGAAPEEPVAASEEPGTETAAPGDALFLRDLFLDKVFREDGLFTRAGSEALKRYRRHLLLFALGILLLALLFVAAFVGFQRFSRNVGAELGLWERVSRGWVENRWEPIVRANPQAATGFDYRGAEEIAVPGVDFASQRFPARQVTLVDLHRELVDCSATPIAIPWTFEPWTWFTMRPNAGRLQAQRVVFEGSVVLPLLESARQKMAAPPAATAPDDPDGAILVEAKALTELIRVEVDILSRIEMRPAAGPGADFVPTLLEYVAGVPGAPELVEVMNWTYDDNPKGQRSWAPAWASGGDTLARNKAISDGLDRLIAYAQSRSSNIEGSLAVLQDLANSVSHYATVETQLSQAASIRDDLTDSNNAVANAFESLEAAKIDMEKKLQVARAAGLFAGGVETLEAALDTITSGRASSLGQIEIILEAIEGVLPKPPSPTATPKPGSPLAVTLGALGNAPQLALLQEIRARLSGVSNQIKTNVDTKVDPTLVANYQKLDLAVLVPYQQTPSYLWRWNVYAQCASAASEYYFHPDMYLVDARWRQLVDLTTALRGIQSQVDTYNGQQAPAFITTCTFLLQRVQTIQTGFFMKAYVQQARDALLRVARFPLVWPPGPDNQALDVYQLQGAKSLLDAIAADLQAPAFTSAASALRQPVLDFANRIAPLSAVVNALIKPDGTMTNVTITLYNGAAQRQLSGPNFAPPPAATPTPSPPPRSLMSKVFFGLGSPPPPPPPPPATTIDPQNWNAVSLVGTGPAGAFPLSGQGDVTLATFPVQNAFSFRVYHTLSEADGSDLVNGGKNWSALRLIAQLGGKPLGVGRDWQVSLKPNEPMAVWLKFSFEQALPTTPWPTLDGLGLDQALEPALPTDPSSSLLPPS